MLRIYKKLKPLYKRAFAHKGFKRYLKNTNWLLGGQIFRLGIGLFVSVAIARYMGPEDFGLYNYILSIITLVGVFGQLGLGELAKRELVESPERRDEIMGTCFVLNLLAGGVIYVVMLALVAVQTDRTIVLGLFALLGSSLLLAPLRCIELWFQAQVRSDLSVVATSLTLGIFAVFKLLAIVQGAGLIVFGYIFLLEGTTLCILQVFFYHKYFGSIFKWQLRWSTASAFLQQSWPLILTGLSITVFLRIDQIMLGAMLGEAAVGQYSVAVRISTIWYFIPGILTISLFPAIVNSRNHGGDGYETRLQAYFDLSASLAYLVAITLSIIAPWIIQMLFGLEYQEAGAILAIHAWGTLFAFLGTAREAYLMAEKMFKFSMYCTLVGAFLNIILNYLMIPSYGGCGSAVASVVSLSVSGYISSVLIIHRNAMLKGYLKSIFVPLKWLNFIVK